MSRNRVTLVTSIVVAFGLSFVAVPAAGYKISIKGRFHERFTVLAERCLPVDGSFPLKCAVPASRKAFTDTPWHEGEYWRASRWPDDPTRQTSSTGLFKFLGTVGMDQCIRYVGPFNDFPGLTCNSHYGTLQFFHSMASIQPGETVAGGALEPAKQTVGKMLDWAGFSAEVAMGRLGNQNYCVTVRALPFAGNSLAPPSFPYCDSWTVATFYGFTCRHLLNSKKCPAELPDAEIRRAATGALLHMVQDSYSRSHAGRGEQIPDGPYDRAEVRCQAISSFYRYDRKQKENHGDADRAPSFATDCASAAVMDPITASARIIWFVRNGCDSTWVQDLVFWGVIRNSPTAIPQDSEACHHPLNKGRMMPT